MASSLRLPPLAAGSSDVFPDLSASRRWVRRLSLAVAWGVFASGATTASAQDTAASAPFDGAAQIAAPRASSPTRSNAPATPSGTLISSQNWASLSASQKEALAPLSKEWDQLDGARKGKWLEIAARYQTLPAEHQQRLRERMAEWTRMSPSDRQRARIGYQHASELRAPEQETKMREKWDAYQALPPEKRQRLVERAAEKASAAGRDVPAPPRAKAPIQRAPLTASTGPTIVQALPGATTVLMTQRAEPPLPGASAAPGRPIRSPREAKLDPDTLLPRRDPASR